MPHVEPWFRQAARDIDHGARKRAEARQGILTKPPGSLGRMEQLAIRVCGWHGDEPRITCPAVVVFAADHGIAADGVSAFPQAVTGEMVRNFASGGAAISVIARSTGSMLEVVNLGTVNDPGELPGVVRHHIAPQTRSFRAAAAMTPFELEQALDAGKVAVTRALDNGTDLLACGEMGIGNTSAATAMTCALLNVPVEQVVGPGTGLDDDGLARKSAILHEALAFHGDSLADPLEVLRRLGGFEIAAMTGAFIAAAQQGLPVLVDGFIASAAALVAMHLQSGVAPWMQLSHVSAEPGHGPLWQELSRLTGCEPMLDMAMRLGEGSGGALCIPLLQLACDLHREMATFDEAGVSEASAD